MHSCPDTDIDPGFVYIRQAACIYLLPTSSVTSAVSKSTSRCTSNVINIENAAVSHLNFGGPVTTA